MPLGTATIDFGAFPGSHEAAVTVTGQTAILVTSKCDAYVMGDDSTADHNAEDHRWLECFASLTCGTPTAANGFSIRARSTERLQGTFALRWVWVD